ncbi:MAG: N-acetylmuramoyl-L-alanine amidase [Gammaproteobacteria bacterium]|nr:N-acetylmuramoyl-L-alanine amidase [Gammaproteobacteria bacterium]
MNKPFSLKKFSERRQFMQRLAGLGGMAALSLLPQNVLANARAGVKKLRLSSNGENLRLVFDLDAPVRHTLFSLSGPERVVIDLDDAHLLQTLPNVGNAGGILKRVRSAIREGKNLRVVLDLNHRVRSKSQLLPPNGQHGYRLVIDLTDNRLYSKPSKKLKKQDKKPLRKLVVAIDAGHGGRDPGATGYNKTREKDVTLAVAKKLYAFLKREKGIKPVMIRNKDQYISLRDRVKKARLYKADLLVSVHADAYRDRRAKGASVYALSLNGASSEAAKWLADKENAVDLLGGVALNDKDDLVAEVLLDLSQTATIQSSLDVGSDVLKNLKKIGGVHKRRVQQAGFAVLKSPDIPSILVETAFISNREEERKLRSHKHQQRLAKAILKGVKGYLHRNAPPGTLLSRHS